MKLFPCLDKKPLVTEWPAKAAPYSYWEKTAYASHEEWGCPTGEANGFWVFDVDKKSSGLDTLSTLTLPDTHTVETRNGGRHLYFKWPATGGIRNRAGFLPGIDIRGEGGYVILYGEVERERILDAPAWLLEALRKPDRKLQTEAHGEVGEGGRNHFLAAAAGRMQRIGVLTLSALQELNETKCAPPLDDSEVELIFTSVGRYAPDSTPEGEVAPGVSYDRLPDLAADFFSYVSDEKQIIGEATGIAGLDSLLGGGIRPGEIIGVLAPAKTGKSTLTHKIIYEWINRGLPVGYASREMRPATEVLPNLLSIKFKKNALRAKFPQEEVVEVFQTWPLYFAKGFGHFGLEDIEIWMRELAALGVSTFVFDHLIHFVNDEDYKIISQFARGIKQLVSELQVRCLLVIQPKQVDAERKVSFRDIRGGAAVGQAIDSLIVLERMRDEDGKLNNVTEIRVDIVRHKLARCGSLYLSYDRDTMDYEEVEPLPSAEPAAPSFPSGRISIGHASSIRPGNNFDGSRVAAGLIKRMSLER